MAGFPTAGARRVAAPLAVAALAVAGCSGSSGAGPQPAATSAATSTPSADPVARQALDRAMRVTERLSSYSFHAQTALSTGQRAQSTAVGRVEPGRALAYRFHVGHARTEVVRVRSTTYVRKVPGRWSRLAKPRTVLHPTATLIALLRALRPSQLSHPVAHQTRVDGTLPLAVASRAGIPAEQQPPNVTVVLDAAGHVVRLSVASSTSVGGRTVTVTVRTQYADFNHAQPIHPPV